MFFAKIPRHTRQNAITEGDLECILTRNCEGTEQLRRYKKKKSMAHYCYHTPPVDYFTVYSEPTESRNLLLLLAFELEKQTKSCKDCQKYYNIGNLCRQAGGIRINACSNPDKNQRNS